MGWVGYQQELKAPLRGLLDQLVHFGQMYWPKTLSGGNGGWVGLGQILSSTLADWARLGVEVLKIGEIKILGWVR